MSAVAVMLGERLHLQHGPIDLIVSADGDAREVRAAYAQARAAFEPVLQTLVDELDLLRRDARSLAIECDLESPPPCAGEGWVGVSPTEATHLLEARWPHPDPPRKRGGRNSGMHSVSVSGPVARRMVAATAGHDNFITPMAAVAGSVADHILAALRQGRALRRASVNNGGDIALWLAPRERYRIGVCTDPQTGAQGGQVTIRARDGVGGVATSGWRGRSHSLGIADAVTVLARSAAEADAAATLIANAVDLPGSEKVIRERADEVSPDSDLGARLVTVDVAPLTDDEKMSALAGGESFARTLIAQGRIVSAYCAAQSAVRVC